MSNFCLQRILSLILAVFLTARGTILSEPITNEDLEALGESFFALEGPNNVAHLVKLNLQEQTCEGCVPDSDGPLLTVDPTAYDTGTLPLLVTLFDNYVPDVGIPEDRTPGERWEEIDFINAIWGTDIFTKLKEFLAERGVDFSREKFRQMWFDLYSRSGSILGSCGFEHVFMGELSRGEVSMFHGWAFWGKEEEAGRLDYKGWMKYAGLSSKGTLIQHNFLWHGMQKKISSMFVGTSPEFEMAVFTACWIARPNSTSCPMSFDGRKVNVTTYTIGESKQFVAAAYPDFEQGSESSGAVTLILNQSTLLTVITLSSFFALF